CPGNALRAACRGSTARRRDGLRRLARASGVRTLVAGGARLWDRGCAIRALGVAALGPPRHRRVRGLVLAQRFSAIAAAAACLPWRNRGGWSGSAPPVARPG